MASSILNNRGDLSDTLKAYFNKVCDKELMPKLTDQGFRFDWPIIGKEFENIFGYENVQKPQDLDFEKWIKAKPQVRSLVNWLSINLFYPTKMVKSRRDTDKVLIRIAVSKLNRIDLPREYKDTMFDNLIYCYYNRKYVYNDFFYKEIMDLPF